MIEEGLQILLKCKNDLEVETIVENMSPSAKKEFPKTAALIDSPFSGLQLRLMLLAEVAQSAKNNNVDLVISTELLSYAKLLLEQAVAFVISPALTINPEKDIISACIQLGFGRQSDNVTMYATRELGLEARQILLSFCDMNPLADIFRDLCLIMSVEGAPFWCKIGCVKVIQRCIKQRGALTAFLCALLGEEGCLKSPKICEIKNLVGLAGPLDGSEKFEEIKKILETPDRLQKNIALFLSIVVSQQKIYQMITFDENEAELSMRRIKVVLQHLPENTDIIGLQELHKFVKSQTKIIYQYALALSNNVIETSNKQLLQDAVSVLSVMTSSEILSLLLYRADFSFDFDLTRINPKPFSASVEIPIMAELVLKTSRECRLNILVDLIKFSFRSKDTELREAFCLLLSTFLESEPEFIIELMNNEDNIPQILTVCELIFPHADDSDSRQFLLSIVALLLSDLVGYSLSTKKLVRERMAPLITQLIHSEENPEVMRTAKDILTKVLTFGNTQNKEANEDEKKKEDEAKKKAGRRMPSNDKRMTLQTWSEYLDSREIPLRSGAIRELTAALRQNRLTEQQSDKLEKNCMAIVKMQTEPFLFLSAVQALTVFALKRREIFDNLVEFLKNQASQNPALAVQVGEVLSRACKELGDMAPCYASTLIPVLLSLAANKKLDDMVVSSAISAAADLLPLCKFLIQDIEHEIGAAIVGFLSPSNEEGVRCAACLLAKQIFAVIGASFSTLVGGIVLDVYRALKKVVNDPLSSKWLYNDAALALESVDDAVKDYLTPSKKMEKKIQILD
ncbi:unnamed protein product [Oikopleura dioica]|uniref:RNA polymerase II assembly factor Rtp1 C-terminal domain-containing protein n=1 Tax=Oikopleura dioica TaxID=34765 RepID=E4YJE4_OIKDI|nr:unnamed protein product [Oikopleura dioica]